MNVNFWPLPRSTRAFPTRGATARYVKPAYDSFTWQGSDWASPTSLTFAEEILTAERLGHAVTYADQCPVPPEELVANIEAMWSSTHGALTRGGYVVDAQEHVGFRFRSDVQRGQSQMVLTVDRAWPAIPGVTTPTPDVTW